MSLNVKKLIINADDFGWSREVVDAIIELHEAGIVSSTSVMATMPAFEYGVSRLLKTRSLEAGVHLSLFDGRSVMPAEKVPGIADRRTGKFFRFNMIYRRMRLPQASEIEAEFRAQIKKVMAAGIIPTHLDVHVTLPYYIPYIYSVVMKLNSEYGLAARTLVGADLEKQSRSLAKRQHLPAVLIRRIGRRLIREMDVRDIRYPDYFIPDFSDQDSSRTVEQKAEVFYRCLAGLHEGISELITHPSSADEPWRSLEYRALRDFAPGILREFPSVKLCSYSELS